MSEVGETTTDSEFEDVSELVDRYRASELSASDSTAPEVEHLVKHYAQQEGGARAQSDAGTSSTGTSEGFSEKEDEGFQPPSLVTPSDHIVTCPGKVQHAEVKNIDLDEVVQSFKYLPDENREEDNEGSPISTEESDFPESLEPVYVSEGGTSTMQEATIDSPSTSKKSLFRNQRGSPTDISAGSIRSDRLAQTLSEPSSSKDIGKALKLVKAQPSDVSINAVLTPRQVSMIETTEVLQFLAPQLNQNVSELIIEEKKLPEHDDYCGSKGRIGDALARIKASRKEIEVNHDSDGSVGKPSKPSEKMAHPQKNRRKKLGKVSKRQRRTKLNEIIAKKLDYEDNIFDFVEPLLSRAPSCSMNSRLKEYTTAAQHMPKLKFKLRQKTNYFKDLNLLDFRKYEANNQSVVDALWDAMLFLKEYIGADEARIYHAEGNCIVRYRKENCNRHPTNWPVEPGTIAAAYAAHMRQTVYLQQKDFNHQNHPLGLGVSGVQPQRTVILPMLTPSNRVLAVMEFDNNSNEGFKEEEIHYALAYGSWVTAALIRKGIRESLKDAKEYNTTILNCLKCFLHEKLTLNQCISAIMITMRTFVKAEQVVFYHIIADKKLDADIYEATSYNRDLFTKVSKKIDIRKDLLMKDVAENHVVVNIHKNEGEEDFSKYHIFDKTINSILCVPIGNPKRLLGIVKVINKLDHSMFFDIDLVNVSNAGMYCTSIIFYTAIGKQLDNTITIANKQKVTLTRHMIPCPHDILQFRSKPITKPPPYYLSFEWYPTKEELAKDLLADYVWWMFNDLFEGDVFMEKFDVFLLMCKKGYRKTSSYHNFEHAFCATHCMFVIVRTCSQKFSYLEQMALMCAMLCHDIDHPGNTNPFLKASEHPLSKLYKFAFLENHHSNVTRILINHCKIFDHLAPDDYKAMVDDMHRLIVATDLAKHFRKKKYLDDLVKEKRFDESLPAHKMHLKSIIMTTCDLSGQFKSFDRTRDITFSLYVELYGEGDWLKTKGLPVHSTLDRTRYLDIPQDQVNFLSMVVIPCVHLLVQMVPVLKDPYTLSNNNLDIWRRVTFSKLFH